MILQVNCKIHVCGFKNEKGVCCHYVDELLYCLIVPCCGDGLYDDKWRKLLVGVK